MSSTDDQQQQKALQKLNYANIVAYVLNTLVTYGVGVSGRFPTNSDLSVKYQTLVTPAGFAFAIWGIIFTAELIWGIVQLLPKYRSNDLVTKVVGWNYVYTCIAQIAWTLCFTTEYIALSLISMISILIPLVVIITKCIPVTVENTSSYWLLKFPFEIHGAWIMAATLVNTNVLLVAWHVNSAVQVGSAWLSLATVAIVASYYTYKKIWVVPAVLAWATNGIRSELSSPKDSILNTFTTESIAAIKTSAGVLAIGILVGMAIRFIIDRFFAPKETPNEPDMPPTMYTSLTANES